MLNNKKIKKMDTKKMNNNETVNEVKMGKLNLLFLEGNRQKLEKENVKSCYFKIKSLGFIKTMPIEYVTMADAKGRIGEKKLFKVTVERGKGEGDAIISNFKINMEVVKPEDYDQYDGVCVDGQHRSLALHFADLEAEPTYTEVSIPEGMDILSYIALRNNGKNWNNTDFYNSGISTGDDEIDHVLTLCKEYKAAFVFALYTFGTINLTSSQIKAILLGYKKTSDFGKLQLNKSTREIGDKLLQAMKNHSFLTKDRFSGRFAEGLKSFYNEMKKDEDKVLTVINLIDKEAWDRHFTPNKGQSLEVKAYVEAFKALYAEYEAA